MAPKMSEAGRAAVTRQEQQPQGISRYFKRSHQQQPTTSRASRPNTNQLQGNISEDEALARALQASLNDQPASSSQPMSQEEQDRMLAMQLAQGEQRATTSSGGSNDKTCQIS